MPFTGLLGRIVYALLAGLVAFIVLLIIGIIVEKFDAEIGELIQKFAPLIGLLVGVLYFLRPQTNV